MSIGKAHGALSFIRHLDAPNREICTVQRPRTSTPLQSLVLMNDPCNVEAARAFAAGCCAKRVRKWMNSWCMPSAWRWPPADAPRELKICNALTASKSNL